MTSAERRVGHDWSDLAHTPSSGSLQTGGTGCWVFCSLERIWSCESPHSHGLHAAVPKVGFKARVCLSLSTCFDVGIFSFTSCVGVTQLYLGFFTGNFPCVAIDLVCPREEMRPGASCVITLHWNSISYFVKLWVSLGLWMCFVNCERPSRGGNMETSRFLE